MNYSLAPNLLIITVILSPVIILFGMILFSGKPKDKAAKDAPEDNFTEK